MYAIAATGRGGPDKLVEVDIPPPVPGPGELLVEVDYAGVNFIDTYERRGIYPVDYPAVLGREGSGRVIGRGAGVEGWWDGTRVAWADGRRSYADKVVIPASSALYVPDHIRLDIAAALALQGLTAHYLIRSIFPVTDGTTILLTGAAGGVGRLAAQLAAAQGATTVGTVGSQEKMAFSQTTHTLVVDDWSAVPGRVRELVGSVDVVYDGIGRASFDHTITCLRPRGLMCLFGGASGQVPPFDLQRLNALGSLYVTRPTLAHYLDDQEWRWNELIGHVSAGRLDVLIGRVAPLSQAAHAHSFIESGTSVGKILLKVR
ncbi:quinone oxidoreductase family protein [Flaviflexus equikiangi]|uniref:quinone oxidoreductase family protein n=1 Tax=Flaviflexus equikiangi TaxID=2758573 RepID=UPI0015F3CF93|nr:quinone oxidoreductase [Flaviflexus equikiangi]